MLQRMQQSAQTAAGFIPHPVCHTVISHQSQDTVLPKTYTADAIRHCVHGAVPVSAGLTSHGVKPMLNIVHQQHTPAHINTGQ
jgi:hypothetical protein